MNKGKKQNNNLTIAGCITFYCTISISMVFMNKFLLSNSEEKPSPFLMTWIQILGTVFICWVMGEINKKHETLIKMPPYEFKLERVKQILPVTLVFISMIINGNYCLQHVRASFFMIARSLHILFTVTFSYRLFHIMPSRNVLSACIVVTIGYIIGNVGEIDFTWKGLIFGVLASIFSAAYPISIKLKLNKPNQKVPLFTKEELMMYNNSLSAIILIPFLLFTGDLKPEKIRLFLTFQFAGKLFFSIFLSFLMSFAMVLQIKNVSPLTHMIVGSFKGAIQTILAGLLWSNKFTGLNLFGNFLTIFGSFLYSFFTDKEKKEKNNNELPTIVMNKKRDI
ncbi:nucleotide sugar transporter family [Anaeramoeba flamelloides]|uniref:Nucleotide sugar transporter family n=1 Tax=Anaeramoeba flamelloides TaxID=1746091 RepID=A0ABQ8XP46_9EUKA|nr:nucleotide sugar transporter family [Anaeramoeba flamelloides]